MKKIQQKSATLEETLLRKREQFRKVYQETEPRGEHHLELVDTLHGVRYINDSRSCDVDAAWLALERTQSPIIWLAGGSGRNNVYDNLKGIAKEKVRLLICMGREEWALMEALHREVPLVLNASTVRDAVYIASRFAESGDTVLFAPACPSYDVFQNYEERGRAFKAEVAKLKWGGI